MPRVSQERREEFRVSATVDPYNFTINAYEFVYLLNDLADAEQRAESAEAQLAYALDEVGNVAIMRGGVVKTLREWCNSLDAPSASNVK